MPRSMTTRSAWLGAPVVGLDQRRFEEALLARFQGASAEGAVAYVERLLERQLASARFLLVADLLLFALLATGSAGVRGGWGLLAQLFVLASGLLCLWCFQSSLSEPARYASAEADFRRSCAGLYRGAHRLALASAGTGLVLLLTLAFAVGRLNG